MNIDSVKIKNFKSLKDVDIELNNLTLITGVNSSGKSSFIQSLLFFKQNIDNVFRARILEMIESEGFANLIKFLDSKEGTSTIEAFEESPVSSEFVKIFEEDISEIKADFNGKYLNLGDGNLLFNQEIIDENIVFEINYEDEKLKIEVDSKLEIICNQDFSQNIFKVFAGNAFNYLNTDRIHPKNTFDFSQKDVDSNSIGINGEYTAHYLAEHKRKELNIAELQHEDSETLQLLENTYKWLGEISRGVLISASSDASTQSVKLTYQYEYGDTTTSNYSSLNVGFGLTYVLPVIVLILKSKPGDLVIIENPESHLHPAGQSKIAELCAIAASNGVQIIVETHSDHFLNGVRVATKDGVIAPDDSQIYFFEKEEDGVNTIPHPINIDKDGRLDDWPRSFFDEWDNQLDKLLW